MAATSFRLHIASMGSVLKVRATGAGEGQTLCLLPAYHSDLCFACSPGVSSNPPELQQSIRQLHCNPKQD